MSDSRKLKAEFRKKVLTQRDQIDHQSWKEKTKLIIDKVQDLAQFKEADIIHSYVSMNDRKEVGTYLLIKHMLLNGQKVAVPVTNFTDGTLSHSLLTDLSDLKQNKWGVKEPNTVNEIDISLLDMIIVPMSAADKSGNRLGYGKGFYDRFLSQSTAFKAGLVFSEFLFEEIPTEPFDEKLDAIITDRDVIFT